MLDFMIYKSKGDCTKTALHPVFCHQKVNYNFFFHLFLKWREKCFNVLSCLIGNKENVLNLKTFCYFENSY